MWWGRAFESSTVAKTQFPVLKLQQIIYIRNDAFEIRLCRIKIPELKDKSG